MSIHVGDIGIPIIFETGENLSGATFKKLYCKKPNGTIIEWAAGVSGTKLTWTSIAGDFDQAGPYVVQGHVKTSIWEKHTEPDTFTILGNLK